ncbi:MAG: hypothetical protein OXQ99_03955, partial [Chloroflexota bacterium]|nr:hypothetical protein [Chloroflexota bacterium]
KNQSRLVGASHRLAPTQIEISFARTQIEISFARAQFVMSFARAQFVMSFAPTRSENCVGGFTPAPPAPAAA